MNMSAPTSKANCTYNDDETHIATFVCSLTGQTSQTDPDMEMRNYPPFSSETWNEAERKFLQQH